MLKNKFKNNPSFFYSMSIAATWSGAGSFIVGTKVAQTAGIIPWLLWALGNTLCCIVFGLLAISFPKLRAVATSKPVQLLMGFMCIFQIWLNMGGIYEMLEATVLGSKVAYAVVYAISFFFVILYLKKGTYRNVMTDNGSWLLVYMLIALLVVYSMFTQGVHNLPLGWNAPDIRHNAWTCITLAFGGFFYPTFWELLDYNDGNDDETKKINMKKAFRNGGMLFGFYLLFVLAGAFTTYSPAVDLLKAVLVSLVAISTLSSFLYGAMLNFGKKLGTAIDIAAVASWQLLVPMGVMGVWNIMQNTRIWMVFGMFIVAYAWHIRERRCSHA